MSVRAYEHYWLPLRALSKNVGPPSVKLSSSAFRPRKADTKVPGGPFQSSDFPGAFL